MNQIWDARAFAKLPGVGIVGKSQSREDCGGSVTRVLGNHLVGFSVYDWNGILPKARDPPLWGRLQPARGFSPALASTSFGTG
jgi:hypothetical protein